MVSRHSVDVLATPMDLESLEPYWDDLVSQMREPSPFLRWAWIHRWVRHFQGNHQLAVGVLRDEEGRPVAIAPLTICRGDTRTGRWVRHLSWIGGMGEVFGEQMDVIVPAGREAELTPHLLRCIDATRSRWDVVSLRFIPEESPTLPALMEALRRVGMGREVVETCPCRYTEIPSDWAAYEAAHSGRWRRNLRNRWRTFLDDHEGGRSVCGQGPSNAELLDHLARLHRLQWPDGESNFLRPTAWPFHRELALEWLEKGRALMPYLTANARVVAVAYGLMEGGQFSLYQQGWDPEFKDLSLGNLLVHWSMQLAAENKLHTYSMLSGDSRYKAEWCPKLRQAVHLTAFPPGNLKAQLYRSILRCRRRISRHLQKRTARAGAPALA
jgi:CelD/BcsL family acetyltransferase involved in cellulose biosynthesis